MNGPQKCFAGEATVCVSSALEQSPHRSSWENRWRICSQEPPASTCLFVGFVDDQTTQQYRGLVPQLHKRYIDDVVGVTYCRRVQLEEYIDFFFKFRPSLQSTNTISDTELPFLDINLRISGHSISTSVLNKVTDTHSYLYHQSSHPRHFVASVLMM